MNCWVDPPSGWKYGFPKVWNGQGNFMTWVVEQGYPQEEIDRMGEYFYVRQWPVDENNKER